MATTVPPKFFCVYDTETSGLDHTSQIYQFGAIKTDGNGNEIDRIELFCLPSPSVIPSIGAFMTHQIPFKQILDEGVYEPEFARKIEEYFTRDNNTCVLGYNTYKFDDNMIRQLFYRNNVDIYGREFRNNNSRHDMLKVTRSLSSMMPNVFEIPKDEEGNKSLRLEELAPLNGILQERAHDAMSDVEATLGVLTEVKKREPGYYEHIMKLRDKFYTADIVTSSAFLYTDGYNDGMLKMITEHPKNKNSYICLELKDLDDKTIDNMLKLDPDDLREKVYSRDEDRMPLREVRINQCPIIFGPSILKKEGVAENLNIDIEDIKNKISQVENHPRINELRKHLKKSFNNNMEFPGDVYGKIFDGFIQDNDRKILSKMSMNNLGEWDRLVKNTRDPRLEELTIRAVGNIDTQYLSEDSKEIYHNWMVKRYNDETGQYGNTLPQFWFEVKEALDNPELSWELKEIVHDVQEFVDCYAIKYAPELYHHKAEKIKEYQDFLEKEKEPSKEIKENNNPETNKKDKNSSKLTP